MRNQKQWQPSGGGIAARRVALIADALQWLRACDHAFVCFCDEVNTDRYVQFAINQRQAATHEAVTVGDEVAIDSCAGPREAGRTLDGMPRLGADTGVRRHASLPYFGEPDHEPLLMEVGSGRWPGSRPPASGDDPVVVAALSDLGLPLGGGHGTCRNFCRHHVTEPSDILASVTDGILVRVLGAGSRYRLRIKSGQSPSKGGRR